MTGVQKRDAFFDHSDVNLMVAWNLLISYRNCGSRSLPALYIAKMLSMKRLCCRSCDSSLPMKRVAYEGAILVSMVIPCVCR